MATITTRSNQFEDSVTITSEDGTCLEAVVVHVPGTDAATFHLGTYENASLNFEESYQSIYTCPVQAA